MTLQYPAVTDLPTYQRLARYRKGNPDYKLEEIYYQFGRYLLIASSRPGNLPANLQGMWANGVDGPWHVDYHNNINIQMNYWPVCSTNLGECAWPLIDFIRTLVKPGRKNSPGILRCTWLDSIHLRQYLRIYFSADRRRYVMEFQSHGRTVVSYSHMGLL